MRRYDDEQEHCLRDFYMVIRKKKSSKKSNINFMSYVTMPFFTNFFNFQLSNVVYHFCLYINF